MKKYSNAELKWYLNAIQDYTEFSIYDVDEFQYILGIFNLGTSDNWIPISVNRFIYEDISDVVDDEYNPRDLDNISASELINRIVTQINSFVDLLKSKKLETITYKSSKMGIGNEYEYIHSKIYNVDIVYVEADDYVLYIKSNDIPKLIKSL